MTSENSPLILRDAHVAIVGLGLMGASLAYDLRGRCRRVTGVVRRAEAIGQALAAGCVDDAVLDGSDVLAEADIIVLAAPVRTILRQIELFGPLLKPDAILIDLGSTKAEICRTLNALPPHVQAIGGHPMCGKETGGLAAAESGLYRGCTFVLCPLSRTTSEAQALIEEMVSVIGAHGLVLDPARHDLLVAAISHLPYLAACALVGHVRAVAQTDATVWEVAASGFRDSSRVAASDVDMLLDILLTNREAVLAAVDSFMGQLAGLRAALAEGDEAGLRAEMAAIADVRRSWKKR